MRGGEMNSGLQSGSQRFAPSRRQLLSIYQSLLTTYGDQAWWPGDSRFEIMVGAVLTQNTAWTNVEKALANLKAAQLLDADVILTLPGDRLAELIRPSGYYNTKVMRLKNLCRMLVDAGGEEELDRLPTAQLRATLLAVNGVGPETCDDILLYAFGRPVFVIDAYTRRLLRRYGLASGDESYATLRMGFEQALGPDVALYKQYHGLIVQHAKVACAATPRCQSCCLRKDCQTRD
jgi:endonuclease-3 related protein